MSAYEANMRHRRDSRANVSANGRYDYQSGARFRVIATFRLLFSRSGLVNPMQLLHSGHRWNFGLSSSDR